MCLDIEVEGLFRVPGNASRVQILRNAILNGSFQNILTNGPFTQHDVASALKSHLSNLTIFPSSTQLAHLIVADSTFHLENQRNQLKENSIKHQAQSTSKPDSDSAKNQPILDFQTSSEKMTSLDLGLTSSIVTSRDWKENEDVLYTFEIQKKKQIEAVKVLFCLLTNNQRSLLKMLFPLLYSVAKKQKTTRMSASNLATLFAPHFFRSSKVSFFATVLHWIKNFLNVEIRWRRYKNFIVSVFFGLEIVGLMWESTDVASSRQMSCNLPFGSDMSSTSGCIMSSKNERTAWKG